MTRGRKPSEQGGSKKPILNFEEEVVPSDLKVKVDSRVVARINQYVEFIKASSSGKNVRISPDIVVERCVNKVLDSDLAFKEWAENGRSENRKE